MGTTTNTESSTAMTGDLRAFTPGPWFIGDDGGEHWSVTAPNESTIANSVGKWGNASLIAAAPEMYEALCRAELFFCSTDAPLLQEITAALKKARGE